MAEPTIYDERRIIREAVQEHKQAWAERANRKIEGPEHLLRMEHLASLDPETATAEDLGWDDAKPVCNGCGKEPEFVVQVGAEADYYSSYTARLCVNCVRKALAVAETEEEKLVHAEHL